LDPLQREPVAAYYVSEHIERMLGLPPEHAVARDEWWVQLLHPDDRARAIEESNAADRDLVPYSSEYRMVSTDEREVWVHDQAVLVAGEDGAPAYWQGVMHDISERKRAEADLEQALQIERQAVERLREADEMKNAFLTAVSHDLRTPLSSILGNAITLEHEEELHISPEDRRDLARSLAAKARQLTRIVTDLLDLDRLTQGGTQLSRSPVDVSALVRRCVSNIELGDRTVLVDAPPFTVDLDAPMVERIVENILHNAGRHTPHGTTVWVRAIPAPGGGALIAVEDDGPGVPDELREMLFRPFERGPSASPHTPGVGVGLSLVASFAALHGGRAWVDERPGGGAAFKVVLPGRSRS
jgi:PAS domain S-box-containing protein